MSKKATPKQNTILNRELHKNNLIGQSKQLVDFLVYLNDCGLINNHDFDYEKEAKKYIKKLSKAMILP